MRTEGKRYCRGCAHSLPRAAFSIEAASGKATNYPWKCDECIAARAGYVRTRRCRDCRESKSREAYALSVARGYDVGARWRCDECLTDLDARRAKRRAELEERANRPPVEVGHPREFREAVIHLVQKGASFSIAARRMGLSRAAVAGIVYRNRGRLAA